MNFRAIFYVIGILLSILGASMLIPALVDLSYKNAEWKGFVFCMVFTLFAGGMLAFTAYRKDIMILSVREGFLLTALTWVTLAIFSAFPFWISGSGMSAVDAVFESVSGITTTGSTIMTDLDHTAPGLLLWRALLQWLGGIGIIVTALSVFPFLKLGGMQLFKTESSENEKALPRAAELAASITIIYSGLTFLCFMAYKWTGMNNLDAIAHAMTTIATGGFSTRDASFGAFEGTYADMVAATFIMISALPFVLYLKFVRGNRTLLFKDSQVRVFLWIVFIATMMLTFYKVAYLDLNFLHSLRLAYFHVVVIITGTGYGLHDFEEWGSFPVLLMFCLMFIGGCAGSTTCSIKVFRYQVLYQLLKAQLYKLIHPRGVFLTMYNGRSMDKEIPLSVAGFVFLFFMTFLVLAMLLFLCGLDPVTALSGAATAICNVGPGLGKEIGPATNFASLPDSAKWVLSAGMMLGRLELFTFFVLIVPDFWKRA